jgi:carbonic anhydrase
VGSHQVQTRTRLPWHLSLRFMHDSFGWHSYHAYTRVNSCGMASEIVLTFFSNHTMLSNGMGSSKRFPLQFKYSNTEHDMGKFSQFEFRTQTWFDPANFQGFNQAIPMKSLVIYCMDPRAADIPQAIAQHFGDEVYPGENILDEAGNRIGSTRTLFCETNVGGRTSAAVRSIAALDYLFKIQNIMVVHHSFCGATALLPEQLIEHFHHHHHTEIASLFERESIAITDFEESIRHDVALLRNSPAVPKHVRLYGFFYEINSRVLTEVVRDIPSGIGAE